MSPLSPRVDPVVVRSIDRASRATSIDFGLLMAQTAQESGFRVDAKAKGSTGTGLFRFIDSTWLSLVQRFGGKYGTATLAQQVQTDATGQPCVVDPTLRQRILDLRNDPTLSAALAAEYARLNKGELELALGRPARTTELYLAHFLGAAGAAAMLKAVDENGDAVGAGLMPRAAAANRTVFFDVSGRARTVAEIYESLAKRIEGEAQRLAAVAPASDRSSGPIAAEVPSFITRLDFQGRQLTLPMLAMLSVFALSALQLLAIPRSPSPTAATARRSV
jgi:hypothetical protein